MAGGGGAVMFKKMVVLAELYSCTAVECQLTIKSVKFDHKKYNCSKFQRIKYNISS